MTIDIAAERERNEKRKASKAEAIRAARIGQHYGASSILQNDTATEDIERFLDEIERLRGQIKTANERNEA